MSTSSTTPVLPCDPKGVTIAPSLLPAHRLQSPTFDIAPPLQIALDKAASYLRNGLTVAFPTETVYGLGAHSLDPSAIARVYAIKNRPADNPLIVHVSSLDMLERLLPASYSFSELYLALFDAFWPGPLTLLFPSSNPPPRPAPQTNAIRMPAHPLALALIHTANLPVSAPSANSSGRPSPTRAEHVAHDLSGAEGLGCILDGGACGVGVESTVVDGLAWQAGGGGTVNILRPGGLSVEDVARIVQKVDALHGGHTTILVHGKPWCLNEPPTTILHKAPVQSDLPPSTPGMKYRHYSPKIPVYLLLPSNTFPRPFPAPEITSSADVLQLIAKRMALTRPRIGLLHYAESPLFQQISSLQVNAEIVPLSLGPNATSAAQRLFDGILSLEGSDNGEVTGVDAIVIEGCSDDGLGLAVMERVGKAVGGGGVGGNLGNGQVLAFNDEGRFWVEV